MRRETQDFLIPKSHFQFVYKSSTSVILPIRRLSYVGWNRGNIKASSARRRVPTHFHLCLFFIFKVTLLISAAFNCFKFPLLLITMYRNLSLNSTTDSDVSYVEHSSPESSPIRNTTPAILTSTKLSGAMEPEAITISSVASPETQIVTIESDSNEPTFPYAFGTQHPIVPPSLNDLNWPHNPFNVLATMAVIQPDQEDNPQSPEPSDPSPISTLPMNLSTIEGWETPHTTTDDNTFYSSENEPRRVYWDFSPHETFDSNEPRRVSPAESPSSTPPPPRRQKRRLSIGMSFPKKRECRSTSARHAANPFQTERHRNAQGRTQISKLRIRL